MTEVCVKVPNLPNNLISKVIIGEIYAEKLYKRLNDLGVDIIPSPENNFLEQPVKYHADMSILQLSDNQLLVSNKIEQNISNLIPDIIELKSIEHMFYTQFNICIIGKTAILRAKHTPPEIIKILSDNGFIITDCNQGFAKCSTLIIDDRHIITSDLSIQKAADSAGINCLNIRPGYIKLPGYDYGFIGGAGFKLNEHTVAFTGNLHNHPDEEKITDYIKDCGCSIEYLTDEDCFDIGSAITLTEIC